MKKNFALVDTSRYYIPPRIAKGAIGYESMGSYILSLQAIKELSGESVNDKINEIHNANTRILEEVAKIKSAVGHNKIEVISRTLLELQHEMWGREGFTEEESATAAAAFSEVTKSFEKFKTIWKAQGKR